MSSTRAEPMLIAAAARRRPWRVLLCALIAMLGLFIVVGPARGLETGLLPNLVADHPDHARLETSADEGGLSGGAGQPKLLLRFDGYVHNDGKGALDIRGERGAPNVSQQVNEEVEEAWAYNQTAEEEGKSLRELPQAIEEELAQPTMKVSQRLYMSNDESPSTNPERQEGETEAEYAARFKKFEEENESYLKRASTSDPVSAEMLYVNADGHHHWHLQHVARYSLWNATKTAEVAPSQKVGFCLEDSERVEQKDALGVEAPAYPVYADTSPPYRGFCQRFLPNATSVYEGISPGWRDRYTASLGYQWVDVSDVLPGEYWLREDVNPEHTILEEGSGEKVSYAVSPTIVPGFTAQSQAVSLPVDASLKIRLGSVSWEDNEIPSYAIGSRPNHGTLEYVPGTDEVTYTPEEGFSGSDSFTFSASDPSSEFPRAPEIATISIDVGAQSSPNIAISGAPSEMIVGTSVQLGALVTNDIPLVTWTATVGSITPDGIFTAPVEVPEEGYAVITARSAKGVEKRIQIRILPIPAASPAPLSPSGSVPDTTTSSGGTEVVPPGPATKPASAGGSGLRPILRRPTVVLMGRELIMTTKVGLGGRVRLAAYIGHRLLGGCAAKTPPERNFTCRFKVSNLSPSTRVAVLATLRHGHRLVRSLRSAGPVPQPESTVRGA